MRRIPSTNTTVPLAEKPLVFIFDPTPEVGESIALIVQDEGYRTITAPAPATNQNADGFRNSAGLQEILGEEKPHVCIFDVGGYRDDDVMHYVQHTLLESGIVGDAKIIFMSTNQEQLDTIASQTEKQGKNFGLLPKPFELTHLIVEVQKGIEEVNEARLAPQLTEVTAETPQSLPRRRGRKKPQLVKHESTNEIKGPASKEG